MSRKENLLNKKLKVINVGIETFVEDLRKSIDRSGALQQVCQLIIAGFAYVCD